MPRTLRHGTNSSPFTLPSFFLTGSTKGAAADRCRRPDSKDSCRRLAFCRRLAGAVWSWSFSCVAVLHRQKHGGQLPDKIKASRHRGTGTGGDASAAALAEMPFEDASAEFELEYERVVFRWAAVRVREVVTPATWTACYETTMHDCAVTDVAAELKMSVGSGYIARSRVMARLRELVATFEAQQS